MKIGTGAAFNSFPGESKKKQGESKKDKSKKRIKSAEGQKGSKTRGGMEISPAAPVFPVRKRKKEKKKPTKGCSLAKSEGGTPPRQEQMIRPRH